MYSTDVTIIIIIIEKQHVALCILFLVGEDCKTSSVCGGLLYPGHINNMKLSKLVNPQDVVLGRRRDNKILSCLEYIVSRITLAVAGTNRIRWF